MRVTGGSLFEVIDLEYFGKTPILGLLACIPDRFGPGLDC